MNWIETFRTAAANPSRDDHVVVPVAALRDALASVAAHAQARRDPCTCGHGAAEHGVLGCRFFTIPGQMCQCWRYESVPAAQPDPIGDETLRRLLRQTATALRANLGNYLTASAAALLRDVDAALAADPNLRDVRGPVGLDSPADDEYAGLVPGGPVRGRASGRIGTVVEVQRLLHGVVVLWPDRDGNVFEPIEGVEQVTR